MLTQISRLILLAVLTASAHPVLGAGTQTIEVRSVEALVAAMQDAQLRTTPTSIHVHPGTYNLVTWFESPYGRSGLPAVQTPVTLVGDGRDTTTLNARAIRDGRHLTVVAGGRLTLRGMTLTGGGLVADDTSLGGGAIANFGGRVTLTDSRLIANATFHYPTAYGGAILTTGGRLDIVDSELVDNEGFSDGGAIAVLGGRVNLRRVFLTGNKAEPTDHDASGGALYIRGNADTHVYIAQSTISNNIAGEDVGYGDSEGGGVVLWGGNLVIENSSVIGNKVLGLQTGDGAGLFVNGQATIRNSTFANNIATTAGGGIFNRAGNLKLFGVTLSRNTALSQHTDCDPDSDGPCGGGGGLWNAASATVVLNHSVVALNTADYGPDCAASPLGGLALYSLVGDSTDCTFGPQNPKALRTLLLDLDPQLEDLSDSTSPGRSVSFPYTGSPLIDAGAPAGAQRTGCWPGDQLGAPRRDGDGDGINRCDIGAVEVQ